MASIFTKIINGEIPSFKIKEDDYFFAFLDILPVRPGHTLVIPKQEIDKFFDVDDRYLSRILLFSKPIAHAIEKSFECNRCALSVVGLEVPHAHLHLIPIKSVADVSFTQKREKATEEELKYAQQKILQYLK